MTIVLGCLVGFAAQPVEAATPCLPAERSTKTEDVAVDQLNQDLRVLRELDDKRLRGDITEREYQLLWEAQVARGQAPGCRDQTSLPARRATAVVKPIPFVGPAF